MDIKAMMPNKESAVNLAWNLAAAAVGTALIAGASKKVAQIPATSLNALGAATVAGGIGASAGQFVSWAMTKEGEKESQMMRTALSAFLAAAAIAPFSLDAVKKYVPAVDMSMNSAIALAAAVGTTVAAATYFFPALEEYTGDKAALEKLLADYKKAKAAYEGEAQKLHTLEKAETKDDAAIKASKELIEGKPAVPAKAAVGEEGEDGYVAAQPEIPAVPGLKKEYETALKNAQDALNHKFGTEDLQKAAKALREEVAKKLELVKKD